MIPMKTFRALVNGEEIEVEARLEDEAWDKLWEKYSNPLNPLDEIILLDD